MTEDSDKVAPERLELRVRPRPIRRLNKRTLMIGCAVAALFIAGATIIALSPPRIFKPGERTELYNTDRKQTADGLAKLPKSYEGLPPKLGPPSPGDVGRAFAESEKRLGAGPASETPFQANAEQDVERAERIRQARIAQQAKESGLLFRLSDKQERRKQPVAAVINTEQPSAFRPAPADNAPTTAALLAKAQGLNDRSGEIIPSSQARKLAFVSAKADKETTNPHALAAAPSPYAIMAGSIIPASLITGLNSDLPGSTIAQVTENVYDTVTGEHLLVPQGTKLFGKYDSVVAFGQKRALVVWTRLILPNGNSVVIENLPATDVAGYAGLEDEVDFHTWQLLKGIGLATLLGVGTQLSLGNDESDLVKALRESVQQTTNRAGQRLIERELDVQPTITVRPGWPLRVIVSKDLVLKPYQDIQTVAKAR
ncbi:TrbI/VirB10 family protein [Bradyrhizobium sp. KBS0727]|uniref:TrbI/VirB10 family protein n=1 Tax=unclassified Bradyrhizobium TaxID=2631580 RepID=UPI00110E9321|nr:MULTISPECIES: TrbI/VirB10 family protein [unclassified Bradyrhizobium]QDW40486.1 TrbI/VirB10 family protein [Bradyrhizobium sp. KBS0725]QDW47091.1 TrbI/VirB10 family protein [Bradyrhizobium sp. KBS0727]